MIQLSLFRGVHDTQPRPVTLEELVTMMRTDQSVRDLTEKHRYARTSGDVQGASRYKKMMTSFGVAALFEGGRQQKHIVEFTGLSLVDIDHIAPERMTEILEKVREDEHTLLAYTTLSGHGVRVLARYALNTSNDNVNDNCLPDGKSTSTLSSSNYKQAFLTVNTYYQNLTGLPTDGQCKNVGRISTIAYDEELYYNPEATPFIVKLEEKKSVGRPKRVESGKIKVERCESQVLRELEQRGVVYAPGSHNKYISDACYMMNRYGVALDDCTAWALDRFGDYQAEGNDVASIVRSCYAQTEEHGTVRVPKASGDKQATVAQIEAFLAERVQLRRNVVTGFVEVLYLNENDDENHTKHSTLNAKQEWLQFTDDDRNSLWRALSKDLGVRVVRQDISAVVKSDFSPRYHPFEEYIGSLQPWDGATDHIARLAASVTVKGDQEYFARCFKKWLVAFIAAIFDPEEVNHEILVFIGRQGSYKSTWFHYLLPPELRQYFLPKLMSNAGITKDDLFKIAQSGLVCLEEIDNMKQRDLNQLKAITTMRTINERRSYGEFNEEENAEINRCNTEFEAPNKEWELINKYYRRPLQSEECKFLTATDILERINGSVKERLSAIRVGNALLAMGYERTRAGNLRGYRVVEVPFADIERKQKDMGKFTDSSNEDSAQKGEEDVQTELPF